MADKQQAAAPASDAPKPFIPVPMVPDSPDAVLNNLLVRELVQPQGADSAPSRTLELLQKTVDALATGESLDQSREELARIISNQNEKNRLVAALCAQLDHERLAEWTASQALAERYIHKAVRRGDLSSAEALVVLQMSNARLAEIRKQMTAVKSEDTVTVMERAAARTEEGVERSLQRRWQGTSPQGREIIRKNLFRLKQSVQDAIPIKSTPVKKSKPREKKTKKSVK